MNIFKKIKNLIAREPVPITDERVLDWLGISGDTPSDLRSEVTYFTCLKILGESLGKLPLKLYQDTEEGIAKIQDNDVYNILKIRPNPYMTPTLFWSTVEQNRNHYGNSYAWCRYNGAKLQDLWIMPSNDVTIYIDDRGYFGENNRIWYVYNDKHTGKQHVFNSDNVLHFKTSATFDGIVGKPVREILRELVEGGLESQKFMTNLYKSGLTAKAVLQYTGDLNEGAKKILIQGFEEFANGSKNSGKIIPVPLGMQLTPLDIKLTDSQFFDLKKYSALQIAAAFGIKPNHINDYSKSSYSNSEMQQLSFYVDALQFPLKQYEEEVNYKLLTTEQINKQYFFKFNEKALLRADMKTQIETLSSGVNNAIYTPNEARDYLDLPRKEGGDTLMTNGNYIPVTMVGQQYMKGGDNNAKT